MINYHNRWTELQFYYLLKDIFDYHCSFEDLRIFIKVCKVFETDQKFDVEFIIDLATKIIGEHIRYKPTIAEYVILGYSFGASKWMLRRDTKLSDDKLNEILRFHAESPLPIKPFFEDDYTQNQMVAFIFAAYNIRRVGIDYGYANNRRTLARIQSIRRKRPNYESLRLS